MSGPAYNVRFYKDHNYTGEVFTASYTRGSRQLLPPGFSGKVSSIQLDPGVTVDVFTQDGSIRYFGAWGSTRAYEQSTPQLEKPYQDNIMAYVIKISCNTDQWRNSYDCVNRVGDGITNLEPNPGCVQFFDEMGYRGNTNMKCVTGESEPGVFTDKMKAAVTSLKISPGMVLNLYKGLREQGEVVQIWSNDSRHNGYIDNIGNDWNDEAYSWKLYKNCESEIYKNDRECLEKLDGAIRYDPYTVCGVFYDYINYTGHPHHLCLGKGNFTGRLQNQLSSFQLAPGMMVTLYSEKDQQGEKMNFHGSYPNIEKWNDKAKSYHLRMMCDSSDFKNNPKCISRNMEEGGRFPPRDRGAIVFNGTRYDGNYSELQLDATSHHIDYGISSLRVSPGMILTLFADEKQQRGKGYIEITNKGVGPKDEDHGDIGNIGDYAENWNDLAKSWLLQMDCKSDKHKDSADCEQRTPYTTNVTPKQNCVIFYPDSDYRGMHEMVCIDMKKGIQPLPDRLKGKVSSIKVSPGMQVTLNPEKTAGSKTYTSDTPNLGGDMNDKANTYLLMKDCAASVYYTDNDCLKRNTSTSINHDAVEGVLAKLYSAQNLKLNETARNWCMDRPSLCKDALNKYCLNPFHIKTPECKSWGLKGENESTYEKYATEYCKYNLQDNKFCACYEANAVENISSAERSFISQATNSSYLNNPVKCWSNNCRDYGYKTRVQESQKCPECVQVIEDIYANLENSTNSSAHFHLQTDCKVNTDTNNQVSNNTKVKSDPTKSDPTKTDQEKTDKEKADQKKMQEKLTALLFILIALIIFGFLLRKSKSNPNRSGQNRRRKQYYSHDR